jgi:5-methylcytosine-specific restriction endonuclease McrA
MLPHHESELQRRVEMIFHAGLDEISTTGNSYEKIVVDHPDRFPEDVVKIAKYRLNDLEIVSPTDDRDQLERKVEEISGRPEMLDEPPRGNQKPTKGLSVGMAFVRDPLVVAYVQKRAQGICELCNEPAPFKKPSGLPYLETHHVWPLAEGGPVTVDNCAAVCPNCHRALHSAGNRQTLTNKLTSLVAEGKPS